MNSPTSKNTHYISIDILRAIAFLLVFLYHAEHLSRDANTSTFYIVDKIISSIGSIGWIGVDIFFCISGFLITRVLINGDFTQHNIRTFWISRAARILPAYYFFLVATLTFNTFIATVIDTGGAKIPTLAYFTFTSNIYSFFQEANAPKPFSIIWSLCVEEQFYIIWPILFLLFSKNLRAVCWIAITASIVAKYLVYTNSQNIMPVYVSMFTRIDGLMYGALTCLYLSKQTLPKLNIDKLIVIPFIFSGLYYFNGMLPLAKLTITPVISYFLLATTIQLNFKKIGRELENKLKPLTFTLLAIGRNSYALYLWHLLILMLIAPLIKTDIYTLKYTLLVTIGLSISYAISRVSWHLIEAPCLDFKNKFRNRSTS